jgi:hypothetical protein
MVDPVFFGIGLAIVGMFLIAWNKHRDEENRKR